MGARDAWEEGEMQNNNEIVLFESSDGEVSLDAILQDDTVWLSKDQIAKLFGRDRTVISRHIRAVFAEKEVPEQGNVQKMHVAYSAKPVEFVSLDVIISVGYRVKSQRGVEFRQWASSV
jgi:hypothetical protein